MAGGSGEVVLTPSGKQGGCYWGYGVSLLLRTETLSSSLPCSTLHTVRLGQVTWPLWALHLLLITTITGLIRPLLHDIYIASHWVDECGLHTKAGLRICLNCVLLWAP